MVWFILFMAGLFEVAWAIGLKYANGFTHLWPSIFTLLSMVISVILLAIALEKLPVGTAYAIWTGIGAVGTVLLGIVLFGESASFVRLLCIGFIILGMVGLKLVD